MFVAENGGDYCGIGGFRHIDSNHFAGYFYYCNLLCFNLGDGYSGCKIYIRSVFMKIVVVRAPKLLRGVLVRMFKINSEK